MAANMGAVKLLLIGCCGALSGGSGYLINWPTKSINAGKMQVLFKKFDFEKDKAPWVSLTVKKTSNNNEYHKPDNLFEEEIIGLRKKLKGDIENCINSKSSDDDQNSCKGEWSKIKEKINPYIQDLKGYCEKKEADEITGQNLDAMKGYMDICYDMSEMWYFA